MLPCGQCIGCRLDYSLDWANRLMCEKQMHDESCFITLTYDDEHLPKSGSLVKRDFVLFMKRLREGINVEFPMSDKRFDFFFYRPIRFFHAGEYGEEYGRPHYHALLFGYSFPDRKRLRLTSAGSTIYSSEILRSVWQKGYCSVGDVTFESAAYVARYCLKKVTGKLKEVTDARGLRFYDRVDEVTGEILSLLPEYVTMSRREGIGKSWYEKYKSDVYPHGYSVMRGNVKMPPPRYFDNQYELENPIDMKRIKMVRCSKSMKTEDVWNDRLQKFQKLMVNRDDRLSVMELVKERQLSACRKKLERGQ